jgi:hypothetical protein
MNGIDESSKLGFARINGHCLSADVAGTISRVDLLGSGELACFDDPRNCGSLLNMGWAVIL